MFHQTPSYLLHTAYLSTPTFPKLNKTPPEPTPGDYFPRENNAILNIRPQNTPVSILSDPVPLIEPLSQSPDTLSAARTVGGG